MACEYFRSYTNWRKWEATDGFINVAQNAYEITESLTLAQISGNWALEYAFSREANNLASELGAQQIEIELDGEWRNKLITTKALDIKKSSDRNRALSKFREELAFYDEAIPPEEADEIIDVVHRILAQADADETSLQVVETSIAVMSPRTHEMMVRAVEAALAAHGSSNDKLIEHNTAVRDRPTRMVRNIEESIRRSMLRDIWQLTITSFAPMAQEDVTMIRNAIKNVPQAFGDLIIGRALQWATLNKQLKEIAGKREKEKSALASAQHQLVLKRSLKDEET